MSDDLKSKIRKHHINPVVHVEKLLDTGHRYDPIQIKLSELEQRIGAFLIENNVTDGYIVFSGDSDPYDRDGCSISLEVKLCAETPKSVEQIQTEIEAAERRIETQKRKRSEQQKKKRETDALKERELYESLKKKFEGKEGKNNVSSQKKA